MRVSMGGYHLLFSCILPVGTRSRDLSIMSNWVHIAEYFCSFWKWWYKCFAPIIICPSLYSSIYTIYCEILVGGITSCIVCLLEIASLDSLRIRAKQMQVWIILIWRVVRRISSVIFWICLTSCSSRRALLLEVCILRSHWAHLCHFQSPLILYVLLLTYDCL